jgi:glycosyltransferase involved in cell wall biosynthesis
MPVDDDVRPDAALPDAVPVPRALLVVESMGNNGALQVTAGLARRWKAAGTRIVALYQPAGKALAAPDLDVEQLVPEGGRMRNGVLRAVLRMARAARQADVVVSGSEIGHGLLLGFLVARAVRRPFVVAVHADLDQALSEWMRPWTHPLVRWVHRHADGAVCIAPGVVPAVRRAGLAPDRIRVVRNGVDTARVVAAAEAPTDTIPPGPPVVVATGRLAPQKGNDLLIRAHARVVQTHPHRVFLLNDGPELAALRSLTTELAVQDSVVFAGAVPAPLPSVRRADLFCLPSRHEGLPLALLEAITLGTPVIASDSSPGVREVLDDGRVGELVPVDDVDALSAALARHLGDPTELRRRAALGPEHARSFDIETAAAGWARAVHELSARTRAGDRRPARRTDRTGSRGRPGTQPHVTAAVAAAEERDTHGQDRHGAAPHPGVPAPSRAHGAGRGPAGAGGRMAGDGEAHP